MLDMFGGQGLLRVYCTCSVELAASCSLLSLADSVMKPFWKMYCFRMFASTICRQINVY